MTLADAPGGRENVHVLLVPGKYCRALDRSEGRGGPYYVLGRLRDCSVLLSGPVSSSWAAPLAYVGHADRGPRIVNNRPVAVSPEGQALLDSALPRSADAWLPALEQVPPGMNLVEASACLADWLAGTMFREVPRSPDGNAPPGAGS